MMPDMMLDNEIEMFPLIAQECPHLYLAIRNLILALWMLNPKVNFHFFIYGFLFLFLVLFYFSAVHYVNLVYFEK